MVHDRCKPCVLSLLYDQDEEQDPLLNSFAQLKDILNSIKGEFIHTSHGNNMSNQHVIRTRFQVNVVDQPLITGTKVSKGFTGHIIQPHSPLYICISPSYLLYTHN